MRPAPSRPRIASPSSTFSSADRNGTRSRTWSTMPMRVARNRARRFAVEPTDVLVERDARDPAVGRSSPVTSRSSVVLPLPDGPVTTWKPPRRKAAVVGGRPSAPCTRVAVMARRSLEDRRRRRAPPAGWPIRSTGTRTSAGRRREPALGVDGPLDSPARPRTLGDRPAVGNVDHPVRDPFDRLVVGHDHARHAVGSDEVAKDVEDPFGGDAIELARRLVGEQERRSRREGRGKGDPLLLTARELVRVGPAATTADRSARAARDAGPALGRRARRAARAAARSTRRPADRATAPADTAGRRRRPVRGDVAPARRPMRR